MTVEHRSGYRPPSPLVQMWRALVEGMWRVEHAFERSKAEGRAIDDARLRIFLILMLFGLAFVALGLEAGKRALFHHSFSGQESNVPAEARADLVDRNGELLATDVTHYALYLDPRDVSPGHVAETRDEISQALPRLPVERLDKALRGERRAFLIGDLTPQERDLVHDLGRPGVEFEEEPKRSYPLGATAAHLIGFTDTGGHGIAGAERALDGEVKTAAAGGGAIPLSIDLRIQAALESELDKAAVRFQTDGGAAGIVVDVQTGEILGLASYPTFDLNSAGSASDAQRKNNVAAQVWEAGSVFKVFTLAAALDTGVVNPSTKFNVAEPLVLGDNKPIHDFDKGDTVLTLEQVFTHSSNIGASKTAIAVGASRMDAYMRKFGLYAAAPSELNESTRPLTPHRQPDGTLSESTLAYMSFGQGLSVTPLQIATGMTSIFNGGRYIPLTLKKRSPDETPKGYRTVSESTTRTMLDFMRQNVVDPKGSGKRADVPGLSVGGKTGTAQKASGGHYLLNTRVASFAAVFPTTGAATDKRYLVYILLDGPHPAPGTFGLATAGFTAAPTVGAVINRISPFLGLRRAPAAVLDTAAKPAASAPPMGAD